MSSDIEFKDTSKLSWFHMGMTGFVIILLGPWMAAWT